VYGRAGERRLNKAAKRRVKSGAQRLKTTQNIKAVTPASPGIDRGG
jgi:hypothetical protein